MIILTLYIHYEYICICIDALKWSNTIDNYEVRGSRIIAGGERFVWRQHVPGPAPKRRGSDLKRGSINGNWPRKCAQEDRIIVISPIWKLDTNICFRYIHI